MTTKNEFGHLLQYGYAPGEYMSRCHQCGATSFMDKRAVTCRPCAERMHGSRVVIMLGNLLAVIHRDGGQYLAEHGVEKACGDAEAIVVSLRSEIARLQSIIDSRPAINAGLAEAYADSAGVDGGGKGMSDKTGIEWTDATWNPVTGCSKVSAGCKHCYADRDWSRLQHLPAYKGRAFTDVASHPERLDQPLRWAKPRRIFVNSMSDLFHPDVPDEFIDKVFAVMALAPRHVFQVLTKRPERMRDCMSRIGRSAKILDAAARTMGYTFEHDGKCLASWPLPNVWLGVSVEDQAAADERIPLLLQTPASVRWISAEPLLGPVDLDRLAIDSCDDDYTISALSGRRIARYGTKPGAPRLDWVVVGSESGTKARPCDIEWVRDLKNQCESVCVPFFFKQLVDGRGRKIHTPELDGRIWTDYPSAA